MSDIPYKDRFPDAPTLDRTSRARNAALAKAGLTEETLLYRREKVFNMRAVERLPYQEIANRLKISRATAANDAKWITKFKIKGLIAKDKSIIAEQDVIYSALLDRWLPLALDKSSEEDTAMYATDRIARLLVDQAKLHGHHLPSRDGGAAKELTEAIGTKVLEAMMRLASGQRGPVVEAEIIQPTIEDAQA